MFKEYSEKIATELKAQMIKLEIKAVAENGTFKVIASDETVDRAGEVIKISAWDLTNYMKSPIILFWHDYRSVDKIVWKATDVYVEGKTLVVEGIFAGTETAQIVRQLYDEGILKTVSVWFIPKQRDEKDQRIITEAELLELSFVPVPANPNALSIAKSMLDKAVEFGILKAEAETYAEIPADPETETPENPEKETDEKAKAESDVLISLAEIKTMIAELPSKIAEMVSEMEKPNDNGGSDNGTSDQEKAESAKEALQKVSKVVSDALHKIKL